jgi:hypothetical protein
MIYRDIKKRTESEEKKLHSDFNKVHRPQVIVLRVMSNDGDVQLVWEKEVWPPISPNSNHSDYFACGVTESKVIATPHNKIYD